MENVTQLLRRYALQPRKRFGQNFLVNVGVLEKIVRAVAPRPDEPLLEIGPGVGVLTRMLADAGARVTAVEADQRMVEVLEVELGAHPHVRIVYGDILEVDLEGVVGRWFLLRQGFGGQALVASNSMTASNQRLETSDAFQRRYRVIGNIPYNISSPIFFLLRDHRHLFSEAILMVQREVAYRLIADVGTKDYGLLTIGMGVVGHCERLFDVAPGSFVPPPKVVSSVIRIRFPDPPPYPRCDLERFTSVVRAAFGKRRKTIRNALMMAAAEQQHGLAVTPRQIDAALTAVGIDPTQRPETITIAQFVQLTAFS